ncbi:MAG: hypothetical protein E7358_00200 [Clostridiales bacterium]|nr:hypothetical protein [Clostridiales bacterium]
MSKILVDIKNLTELENFQGEYDGVYIKFPCEIPFEDILTFFDKEKQVFIDLTNLSASNCLKLVSSINKPAVYVVDDIQKAIFIKTVSSDINVNLYYDGYDDVIVPFLSCNKFNLTVKYTALAPERIEKLQKAGVKVNGYVVSRLDEVGVLKFWNTDYITVTPDIK